MGVARRAPLAAALLLAGCVSGAPGRELARATPPLDPVAFFAGATTGEGRLTVVLHAAKPVHVEGEGQVRPDGALLLVQQVREEGKPARTRRWLMRPLGAGRYTGTLTDAAGPTETAATGNTLAVRYRTSDGLAIRQWLYLQPDGRTILNRLVVRKFGIVVARLEETIRRSPR